MGSGGYEQARRCAGDLLLNNERLPLFLLSAYAKNRKVNLSKAERNAMKRLVPLLVTGYSRKA